MKNISCACQVSCWPQTNNLDSLHYSHWSTLAETLKISEEPERKRKTLTEGSCSHNSASDNLNKHLANDNAGLSFTQYEWKCLRHRSPLGVLSMGLKKEYSKDIAHFSLCFKSWFFHFKSRIIYKSMISDTSADF